MLAALREPRDAALSAESAAPAAAAIDLQAAVRSVGRHRGGWPLALWS
jgi:hypothetical protein